MRLGSKSPDKFLTEIAQQNSRIQEKFVKKMTQCTKTAEVSVMLGDSTVTTQMTFDPKHVQDYFKGITQGLGDWTIQDITITNNDDIRRIFTKFEVRVGNYLLSAHLSIQFHVLLYYRTDQRVIQAQKELSGIIDMTKQKESDLADASDEFVLNKLKEYGHKDLEDQKLFEVLFENDEMREKIYGDIHKNADAEFQRMAQKKQQLFDELDNLLVETYQTSPVLIDDARLVTGEEGFLCTLDLEFVKNNTREGLFDPKKMSQDTQNQIKKCLEKLENNL